MNGKLIYKKRAVFRTGDFSRGGTRQRNPANNNPKFKILLLMISVLLGIFLSKMSFYGYGMGGITGGVIGADPVINHVDQINATFDGNGVYVWLPSNNGNITSISLSGTLKGPGSAGVYIDENGTRYYLIKNDNIRKEITGYKGRFITGYAVADNGEETPGNATESMIGEMNSPIDDALSPPPQTGINDSIGINESMDADYGMKINDSEINNTADPAMENKTIAGKKRKIDINLEYKDGTEWDTDNDGIETTEGVIDLTVENTEFNWDVNESNLCTQWGIYSKETGKTTIACYGSSDCCSLIGLAPFQDGWDAPLEIYYGRFNSSMKNKVSAQVIYAEYSLDPENPSSEIVDSKIERTAANFIYGGANETITFTDACADSCELPGLNGTGFVLFADVDNGTELRIYNLTYMLSEDIAENETKMVALKVQDSKDDKVNTKINVYKNKNKVGELDNQDAAEFIAGEYDIEVLPENNTIQRIFLNNVTISDNTTEFIKIDDPAESGDFVNLYAIDPTAVNFTDASVTVTARGTVLMKCKEWNFTEQICDGQWGKLMDIVPGQNYTFTLTPDDPGFAEIVITKAAHLDSNRSIISDIYDEVKEKDNVWSEKIYEGEYVRATFERQLTSANDITLYARNTQGLQTKVEVYPEGSDEMITEFPVITQEKYYKVLLAGMNGSHDTFDLKIVNSDPDNAYLEFDHIIDPVTVVNFTSNGSWTVPSGITKVTVEAWGGGGAGGGSTSNTNGGSGGAGGQYAIKNLTVTQGQVYSIIIGAGGIGSTGAGTSGGNTTFNATLVYAVGGAGGAANAGTIGAGSTSGGIGDTVYAGGSGGAGGTFGGGGGSGAGSTGIGNNASGSTGGAAKIENGGAGGDGTQNAAGNPGNVYGGAGGGGERSGGTSMAGGAGAAGYLRITFQYSLYPYWSNNMTNVTATYSPTANSTFNITWQGDSNVSKVFFESNYSGTATNYSMINNSATPSIFSYSAVLPAGMYYWKSYANDTINQWNVTSSFLINVSRATPALSLLLNGTVNNITINQTDILNITGLLVAGDNNTGTNLSLYQNGTLINSNITNFPVRNLTQYNNSGIYNITLVYNTTKNYTINSTMYLVTVRDKTLPAVLNLTPVPGFRLYNVSETIEIGANVTDNVQVNTTYANITMPNTTIITLNLSKPAGTTDRYNVSFTIPVLKGNYTVNFFANDTSNNINSTQRTNFTVVNTYPNVTSLNYPADAATLNYTTIQFNFTANEDYFANIKNCTLYANFSGTFTANATAYNVVNNTNTNITFDVPDGSYIWNIQCIDDAGLSGSYSSNYTLTVSTGTRGIFVYKESGSTIPQYRVFNDFNFTGKQLSSMSNVGGEPIWVVTKANNKRKEFIVGTEDDQNDVNVQVYNVSSKTWGNLQEVSIDVPNSAYRAFDIACEQMSGDALIVYENKSVADSAVAYRIWNGTGYSAEALLTTTLPSSAMNWVSLVPKSRSDNIMLLVQNSGTGLYSVPWNGTGFDTSQQQILSATSVSATRQHFAFAWEESSGEGIVAYGNTSNNLVYRNYSSTSPFWSTESALATGSYRINSLRMCSDLRSDYIGFIWQNASNAVNVSMWNGNSIVASPPAGDPSTEPSGSSNINLDCAWHASGNIAFFGFIDLNSPAIDYFNFTKATDTWSISDLTSAPTTASFADTAMRGLRFTPNTLTNDIMALAIDKYSTIDTTDHIPAIRWDGTGFQTISASPFETNAGSASYNYEGEMFDWYRFDETPAVNNATPANGTQYNISNNITITANVTDTDSTPVSAVIANITLPDNTSQTVIMLDHNSDSIYNGTFTNTSVPGWHNLTIIANDTSGFNINNSAFISFKVNDVVNPSVFDLRPVAGTNYNVSDVIEIAANATDDYAISFVMANVTYPNSTVQQVNLSKVTGTNKYNNSFTIPAVVGRYNVTFLANDTSGNANKTETTFYVTLDSYPPYWSNNLTNATYIYSPNNQSLFNITWLDNIGVSKAFFESNYSGTPTNYTMTNNSATESIFSYSVNLPAGTYYWKSYANDTSDLWNYTDIFQFTIQKANTSTNLYFNGTEGNRTINYSVGINVTAITSALTTTLYLNGTPVANPYNAILGLGHYNFTAVNAGNANYSSNYTTWWLNVTDQMPPTWSNNLTNATYIYSPNNQSLFNITWLDNVGVSKALFESNYSGTPTNYTITNNSATESIFSYSVNLPAGTYYWKSYANDTSNQWNLTPIFGFTVQKANTSTNLYLNGTQGNLSINYSQGINVTALTSALSLTLYQNGTPVANPYFATLAYGHYNFTAVNAGDANYTGNYTTWWLNVTDQMPPTWSNNLTNATYIYSPNNQSLFNITWLDNMGVSKVLFESDYSGTPTNYTMTNNSATPSIFSYPVNLPAGTYYWKSYANDTSNQWNLTPVFGFTVQKANTSTNLYFNGTEGNRTINYSVGINVTAITSALTTILYLNGTPVANPYNAILGLGHYNFTAVNAGNANYSSNYTTWWLNVTDQMPPTWSNNLTNATYIYHPSNISLFNITWLDNVNVSKALFESNYSGTPTNYTMTNNSATPSIFSYSVNLPAGTYYWRSYANDTVNLWNESSLFEFTVQKANTSTNLYLNGTQGNLSINYSVGINVTALTSTGTVDIYSNGTPVTNPYFATLAYGHYNFTAVNAGDANYTGNYTTWWLNVTDQMPPTWSNNLTNATYIYSPNNQSLFNITWLDNMGVSKVLFESDYSGTPTNYTMTNNSATESIFSYSVNLPAGTYYWKSYANDTSNQWNLTPIFGFTIQKANTSTNLYLNGTQGNLSINYSQGINITALTSALSLTLYQNGTPVANPYFATLAYGHYNFTAVNAGNANYSSNYTTWWLNVTDQMPPTWSNNLTNATYIYHPSNISLFNITWLDNVNVSKALFESNYSGTPTNYTMTNNSATESIFSYSVNLPAGTYYWKSYANDTSNQWNYTEIFEFTVQKANTTTTLYLDGAASNLSITYPATFNATAVTDALNTSIYLNGTPKVTNSTTIVTYYNDTLAAGYYNITAVNPGSANYTGSNATLFLNVTKAASEVNLLLNGTDGNLTIDLTQVVNITGLLVSGEDGIDLYENGILINSGQSPLHNMTQYNISGMYNITLVYNETQNYTYSNETHWINVSGDIIPPSVVDLLPTAGVSYNLSVVIEIAANVTDFSGVLGAQANITLPNTTQIILPFSKAGITDKYNASFNISKLFGRYNITIIANDTNGNMNGTESTYFFGVDTMPPAVFHKVPSAGSSYNTGETIEIAVNATDNYQVAYVYANVTEPDGVITPVVLSNVAGTDKYNSSYIIPVKTGRYNVSFLANDTNGTVNDTEKTYFVTADGTPPEVFDLRPVAGTNYNISAAIEIAANMTDASAIAVSIANITYPNGTVYTLALSQAGATDKYNSSFTVPPVFGQYNITFIANDSAGNVNNTQNTTFIAVDQMPPYWSGNTTNATYIYHPSNISLFNITWIDNVNVSKALFESNYSGTPTNYTMTNDSATPSIFSYSANLPAGTYYWKSYANDSSDQWNLTPVFGFTVQKTNTSTNLYLNGTQGNLSINYSKSINVTAVTSKVNVTIYRNSTSVASSSLTEPESSANASYFATLAYGHYNFTAVNAGNANYSSNYTTWWLNVTDQMPPTWSNNLTNATYIYSPNNQSLFNITWIDNMAVSKAFFESNYSGTPTNYTMTNDSATPSIFSYSVNLPAGTYYWKSYANDTNDQWNYTDLFQFTVQKQNTTTNLYINGTQDNVAINYSQSINITAVTSALTVTIYKNGTPVGNLYSATLPYGVYNFTAVNAGDANYTGNYTTWLLNVTDQIPPYWLVNTTNATYIYSPNNMTLFNITWLDNLNISKAFFESNYSGMPTNYTMTNDSSNQNIFSYSVNLPAGTYYWKSYANDTNDQWNYTDLFEFTVQKQNTTTNLYLNGTQGNLSINYSQGINITAITSELTVTLYRNGTAVNTSSSNNATYFATLPYGHYNFTAVNAGNANYSSNYTTWWLNVTDQMPPTWSTNTTNATYVYSPNNQSLFNITWLDNAGISKAFFESDYSGTPTNYTMINDSTTSWIFSYSVNLPAGTYYWKSYANDTSNQWNYTPIFGFTVQKANTTTTLYLDGAASNLSITYPATFNATAVTDALNTSIYLNGTSKVTNSTTAITYYNDTLAAGYYNITAVNPGNANYTGSNATWWLTVDKATSSVNLLLNGTDGDHTINISDSVNITGLLTSGEYNLTLYENGTQINKSSSPLYLPRVYSSLSIYNLTLVYNATQNYTSSYETHTLNVTDQIPPSWSNPTARPISPATYADSQAFQFNTTWTDNVGVSGVIIEHNFTGIMQNYSVTGNDGNIYYYDYNDIIVGSYAWRMIANDSHANYNSTDQQTYDIQRGSSTTYLYLNGSRSNLTIIYGQTFNATGTTNHLNVSLYINSTLVNASSSNISYNSSLLAAGHYNITAVNAGNGYNGSSETWWLNVTKSPSQVNLLINGTDGDFSIEVEQWANITGLLVAGEDGMDLYENGTLINSVTGPYLVNITQYNISGIYNLTLVYNETENYTYSYETHLLAVGADIFPPVISNINTSPQMRFYNNGSAYNISVNFTSNEYPINITFYLYDLGGSIVNYSGPTQINLSSQLPINYTLPDTLSDGNYSLNMTTSDKYQNPSSRIIGNITVDSLSPVISGASTNPQMPFYNNGSAQNISVNFTSSEFPLNITLYIYDSAGSISNYSGPFQINSSSQLPYNFTIPDTLADSNYSLNLTAVDPAGNANSTLLGNFIVDSTTPAISGASTDPQMPFYNNGSAQDISVNFTSSEFPINITFYLYNSSGTLVNYSGPVQINSSSGLPVNYALPGTIPDGNYTLNLTALDPADNRNATVLGNITVDGTAPKINDTVTSPALPFYTNGTVQNISVRFNSTEYPLNITFYLYNSSGTLVNYSGPFQINSSSDLPLNYTFPAGLLDGNHTLNMTASDPAGNINNTRLGYFTVDTLAPAITLLSTSPSLPLAKNSSQQDIRVNFTSSEFPINITFHLYNLSGDLMNSSAMTKISSASQLPVNYTIPAGLREGNYTLNLSSVDMTGNLNLTRVGLIMIDDSSPLFISLETYPNTTDGLDPGVNISILANVTDNVTSISSVTLQYKLFTDINFINLTMSYNATSKLYNAILNVTTGGNYSLKLYSVDAAGNTGTSNAINRSIELERTWTRTPSSFTAKTADLNQQVTIGNLTINNTGDYTLSFNITSDSNETVLNDSSTFTLSPGAVKKMMVNDTALAGGIKTITLNISAPSGDPTSQTTTGTIVVAPNQPVLVTTFTNPAADAISVTQGQANVQFTARVKNLGEGNASNVNMFFTIPENWTVTFGSLNQTFAQILSGGSEISAIQVTIPSNATTGLFEIIANSTGYNDTGVSLDTLGLLFGDKVNVTVNAPSTSLGQEPSPAPEIPQQPTLVQESGKTVQTGGQVFRVPGQEVIYTRETISILRGDTEGLNIGVTNFYENAYFTDVNLEVLGFLSEYVRLSPVVDYSKRVFVDTKQLYLNLLNVPFEFSLGGQKHRITVYKIRPGSADARIESTPVDVKLNEGEFVYVDLTNDNESDVVIRLKNVSVQKNMTNLSVYLLGPPDPKKIQFMENRNYSMDISAPKYLYKDNMNITVKITANVVAINPEAAGFTTKKIVEYRTVILKIQEVSETEASAALDKARREVKEMVDASIPSSGADGLLSDAENAFKDGEYEDVVKSAEKIDMIWKDSFDADRLIKDVKEGIDDAKSRWLEVPQTEKAIGLAMKAFEREDFVTAIQRSKDAQLILILETKGKINMLWFLRMYWWLIIAGIALASLAIMIIYQRLQIAIINFRIRYLTREEDSITSLKEDAQDSYFNKKSISSSEYSRMMGQFENRLLQIRRIRNILRSRRVGMLRIEQDIENLEDERRTTLEVMKKTQVIYLEKGLITQGKFNEIMKSDRARIMEMEREKTLLEEKLGKEMATKHYGMLKGINNAYRAIYSLFERKEPSIKIKPGIIIQQRQKPGIFEAYKPRRKLFKRRER